MQKLEFEVNEEKSLIKAIIDELPSFSRFHIEKLIKKKDIRVNQKHASGDENLRAGDKVIVYYESPTAKEEWYKEVYSDDNILIVNKRAGIETVSDKERDLLHVVKIKYPSAIAVHRLDRNTEGLVIFALNENSKVELEKAFKTRKGIVKKYVLLVHGRVDPTKIKRTVYLKKIEKLNKVWISEVKTTSYEPAITEFEVVKYNGDKTLLEANLVTGKTHQIRAHVAYYNYPIVGDNKYGKDNEKILHLTSYKLSFNFDRKSLLSYLNSKSFEIIPSWLD